VNLVRCSTDEQADTSPQDQCRILQAFAVEHGMIHAGNDIILEGVSGSVPSARTDIDLVIARKREHDDFDVLLVQDYSRFTRGGIDHGGSLKWELAEVGIEVIFVTFGTTGDMDQDSLIQSVGFFSAQQQAKTMSYAITRGQMSALASGNIPHTFRIPYGIDRLYVGFDGVKRHRIRNLLDGTQQRLAADSDEVLATYGKNPAKGASIHYHRQSDEKAVLVPGDPRHVEVVRRIYRMRLLEGKGIYLIARTLNDEGEPSPTNGLWSTESVNCILHNPTYTGVGISDRHATGIYYVRGKQAAPLGVHRSLPSVAQRKKSDMHYRPRDQWKWQPYPLLADYLSDEMKELARVMHEKEFAKQHEKALAPQVKRKPGGDKHADSPFILKDLLRSKQGNRPMTGRRTGPKNDRRRYYAVSRGTHIPKMGSMLGRLIPAEPLEQAVLSMVKDVLLDVPNLRQRIERSIEQQRQTLDTKRQNLAPMLAERDEIAEQLRDALKLGPSSRKLMKQQFDQWEARLAALEQDIAMAETSASGTPELDVEGIVQAVTDRLAHMAASLDGLPPAAVRNLIGTLVSRLEVDLETREVEMDIALPQGVTLPQKADNGLRMTPRLLSDASADKSRWHALYRSFKMHETGDKNLRRLSPRRFKRSSSASNRRV
jgi:hypothetical protein